MSLNLRGYTSEGGRSNNEDAFYFCEKDGSVILVVADGLGGHECGELASECAVNVIKDIFLSAEKLTRELVTEAVLQANSKVLELQESTGKPMKTTVCVVYIDGDKAVVAHVGDSRIYALKQGLIVFQSEDHSASQLAVILGEITKEQIRFHEERNVLTKALGAGENLKPSVSVLKDFDAFLVCSDGFWEFVLEADMEKTCVSSNNAEEWLLRLREIHDKSMTADCDNNTAVVWKK